MSFLIVLLTVVNVLLLRFDLRAHCIHILPQLFPFLVFNDFVMPSLFPATSVLHKSIRFYSIVSKAGGGPAGLDAEWGGNVLSLLVSTNQLLPLFYTFPLALHHPFQRIVAHRPGIVLLETLQDLRMRPVSLLIVR